MQVGQFTSQNFTVKRSNQQNNVGKSVPSFTANVIWTQSRKEMAAILGNGRAARDLIADLKAFANKIRSRGTDSFVARLGLCGGDVVTICRDNVAQEAVLVRPVSRIRQGLSELAEKIRQN